MKHLTDKVAIVTGASSGIGRAAALLFAAQGARVVAVARRREALDDLVDEIEATGGVALACCGDVREEGTAEAATALALERFGRLDVALNNAGTLGTLGPVTDMTRDDWQETLDANLTSAFLGAKHQLAAMAERGRGSLIFTSSFVGYTVGLAGMAAYGAGKAGVIGLAKVLAAEYGPLGIRVNALLPGGTDTPMGASVADTPEARTYVAGLHALKRIAAPQEIAESALFLASDASGFVTGTALLADGGVSISRA